MKTTFFLIFTLLLSPLLVAQVSTPVTPPATPPAVEPEQKYEWREFATADVRNIVFNATTGFLIFTVGDVTYRHSPGLARGGQQVAPGVALYGPEPPSAANVAAVAATLAEMRLAKRLKVRVPEKEKEAKTLAVTDLVLLYDKLN